MTTNLKGKYVENNIVNGTHIITFMRKTNHLNFHYCIQFDPVTESEYRDNNKKRTENKNKY